MQYKITRLSFGSCSSADPSTNAPFGIKAAPGITAKQLAELDRVSAAAMSVALGRLEKAGLIERTRGEDRRCVSVTLSAAGEKVLRSAKQRRTAWLAARLQELDDDERDAIDAALPALARLL